MHHDHRGLHEARRLHHMAPGHVDVLLGHLPVFFGNGGIVGEEIRKALQILLTDLVEALCAHFGNCRPVIRLHRHFEAAFLIREHIHFQDGVAFQIIVILRPELHFPAQGHEPQIAVFPEHAFHAAVLQADDAVQTGGPVPLHVGGELQAQPGVLRSAEADLIVGRQGHVGVACGADEAEASLVSVIVVSLRFPLVQEVDEEVHVGDLGHVPGPHAPQFQDAAEIVLLQEEIAPRPRVGDPDQFMLFIGLEQHLTRLLPPY